MYKTGLFVGKFMPPHIGHKQAILNASKLCEQLIVLVCYEPNITQAECTKYNLPPMPLDLKFDWLTLEFRDYPNISILKLDETGMPPFPTGWEAWSKSVQQTVHAHIDVIFGSEINYSNGYHTYFPNSNYVLQDIDRKEINISSTMIRKDLKKYLNYILPSARKYFEDFAKK